MVEIKTGNYESGEGENAFADFLGEQKKIQNELSINITGNSIENIDENNILRDMIESATSADQINKILNKDETKEFHNQLFFLRLHKDVIKVPETLIKLPKLMVLDLSETKIPITDLVDIKFETTNSLMIIINVFGKSRTFSERSLISIISKLEKTFENHNEKRVLQTKSNFYFAVIHSCQALGIHDAPAITVDDFNQPIEYWINKLNKHIQSAPHLKNIFNDTNKHIANVISNAYLTEGYDPSTAQKAKFKKIGERLKIWKKYKIDTKNLDQDLKKKSPNKSASLLAGLIENYYDGYPKQQTALLKNFIHVPTYHDVFNKNPEYAKYIVKERIKSYYGLTLQGDAPYGWKELLAVDTMIKETLNPSEYKCLSSITLFNKSLKDNLTKKDDGTTTHIIITENSITLPVIEQLKTGLKQFKSELQKTKIPNTQTQFTGNTRLRVNKKNNKINLQNIETDLAALELDNNELNLDLSTTEIICLDQIGHMSSTEHNSDENYPNDIQSNFLFFIIKDKNNNGYVLSYSQNQGFTKLNQSPVKITIDDATVFEHHQYLKPGAKKDEVIYFSLDDESNTYLITSTDTVKINTQELNKLGISNYNFLPDAEFQHKIIENRHQIDADITTIKKHLVANNGNIDFTDKKVQKIVSKYQNKEIFLNIMPDSDHNGAFANRQDLSVILKKNPDVFLIQTEMKNFYTALEISDRYLTFFKKILPDKKITVSLNAHGGQKINFGSGGRHTSPQTILESNFLKTGNVGTLLGITCKGLKSNADGTVETSLEACAKNGDIKELQGYNSNGDANTIFSNGTFRLEEHPDQTDKSVVTRSGEITW